MAILAASQQAYSGSGYNSGGVRTFPESGFVLKRALARPSMATGDWLAQIQAQHREISRHFSLLRSTNDRNLPLRIQHLGALKKLLASHAVAEEQVLYPHFVNRASWFQVRFHESEPGHARMAVMAIDEMPTEGRGFFESLREIEAENSAHMIDEENRVYPDVLRRLRGNDNARMSDALRREFNFAML